MAFTGYDYSSGLAMLGQGVNAVRKRWDEQAAAEAQALGFDQWAAAQAPQSLAALGQPAAAAAPAAPSAPSFAGGRRAMSMPADPEVEGRFIGELKAGGLTNPVGLAALAAYANAESGYKPGNITGSWADPSQSGAPGTSGGILSWRGPRLDAMRQATQGAPDPVSAQAKFALTENPDLTVALQNAKTPEEANSLMANAWRFAGYNQPGGEFDRRLGMTRDYLGKVGGQPATFAEAVPGSQSPAPLPPARGDGGVQVASADPSFVPQQMPTPRGGAVSPSEILVNQAQARQGAPAAQPMQLAQTAPAAAGGAPGAISDQQKQVIRGLLANPDTKAMGMALWQQALKPGEIKLQDLGDSVGVFDARGNLLRSVPKTRAVMSVGADQGIFDPNTKQFLVQPQAKPHTTNVKPGEAVVDQNTGQVVYQAPAERQGMFDGKSVEGQALNHLVQTGHLTPEQAAQFGAGKTTTIDGKPFFMTPEGIFQGTPGGAATPALPFPSGGAPAPSAPGPTSGAPPTSPVAPPARPGMIQLGDGKPGNVPAEVGARIGLGNKFLDEDLPWVRDQIEKGTLSGVIAAGQMKTGAGMPGQVMRRVEQGQEALLRNLTGAGMNENEARSYAARYLPQWNDSIDTIKDKLRGLEGALKSTRDGAIAGKGVIDPALVGRGQQQPSQPKQNGGAVPDGATATNPQTGEKIIRRNGQWVPSQPAGPVT